VAARPDDFPEKVKRLVGARAGYHCSNPACLADTMGASSAPDVKVNLGEAAHITAAQTGGPRFDEKLTPEERRSAENAIWLCVRCAKMIDRDVAGHSVTLLEEWKGQAERRSRTSVGIPKAAIVLQEPQEKDTLSAVLYQAAHTQDYQAVTLAMEVTNESDRPNGIRCVTLDILGEAHEASPGPHNRSVNGFPWFPPTGLRVEPWSSQRGAWFFGSSFGGGGRRIPLSGRTVATLSIVPVRGKSISGDLTIIPWGELRTAAEAEDARSRQRAAIAEAGRELEQAVRASGLQWRVERTSEPISVEKGRAILDALQLPVETVTLAIDRQGAEKVVDALQSVLVELASLQKFQIYMDGGRTFDEFWRRGDAVYAKLATTVEEIVPAD